MANFIPYDHRQDVLISVNFEDQLQPGTFEHAIHYLVENKLDLSIFSSRYKNEKNTLRSQTLRSHITESGLAIKHFWAVFSG